MMRLAECPRGAVAGDLQQVTFEDNGSDTRTWRAAFRAGGALLTDELKSGHIERVAGDGRQGALQPAGLFKMGFSGCGQSLQRRFQVIRDSPARRSRKRRWSRTTAAIPAPGALLSVPGAPC
jgi:hypothetical protein